MSLETIIRNENEILRATGYRQLRGLLVLKTKWNHEELCWPLSTLVHEDTLLLARDGCWDTLKFKGPVNFCRAPGWFALCTLDSLLTEGHLSLRLDVNSTTLY